MLKNLTKISLANNWQHQGNQDNVILQIYKSFAHFELRNIISVFWNGWLTKALFLLEMWPMAWIMNFASII